MKRTLLAAALFAAFGIPSAALATDGYFAHGYGLKAKGMGGAATATASDAFGGANNPASMVWAGERLDIGVDLFSPKRSASRSGSAGPGLVDMNATATSDKNVFPIPEFGYNRMLGADKSLGISIYGNGGMNTDYPGGQIAGGNVNACGTQAPPPAAGFNLASQQPGPYNLLCGSGRLGVNLEQLIISPTFAMKLNKDHSFGASFLIVRQTFKAQGLSAFYGYTTPAAQGIAYASGNNLTDRGNDTTWGYGLKLGWMGKVSDTVSLGANYTTKAKMRKFDMYKDLFAGQGYFDMPDSVNLGIAVQSTPKLTIAADYQRINYSGIRSVANSSTLPADGPPGTAGGIANSLGCDSCRGFGWESVNVFKLGIEYQTTPNLMLRAGYNHTDNPVQSRDVTFNILAPGVVKDHATLGFTYNLSKDSELTMAYMHAFKNTVTGASLFNKWTGTNATETIQMYENSLGIAYGVKFK